MAEKLQAVRGMNDLLPPHTADWQWFESIIKTLAASYGFSEIRLPVVESTELFKRSVGEVTDIVEKEMYTFLDKNGDSLTLRPEGTAGCVRAAIQHGLLYNQTPKLWYTGPLFRHERPQKGRYRQFYQVGFESFGIEAPEQDVEMILMNHRLWSVLGLAPHVRLEINTLGNPIERAVYRDALLAFYQANHSALDEDSIRRLRRNPLRILDSKNPVMMALNQQAPRLIDYLGDASQVHFNRVKELLDTLSVPYTVNTRLVRGLDYYCHTVFEWITDALGSQGTISAGGRYDGLVEQLGGKPIPAVGFAMGIERILELLAEFNKLPPKQTDADIYCVAVGKEAQKKAMTLTEELRDKFPSLKIITHCQESSFKSQLKRADQSGAYIALILGEEEVNKNVVTMKYLREDKPQQSLTWEALIEQLHKVEG